MAVCLYWDMNSKVIIILFLGVLVKVSTLIASTLFFWFRLQFFGSLFLLGPEQQSHYYVVSGGVFLWYNLDRDQ